MKKIICLLMSLSLVAFASCSDDDKESPSSTDNTQTENGGSGDNSGNNGDNSGNTIGDSDGNGSQSAVSVFKSGTENGHDYVDLGLTSGTRWATANVGASKPQDYGNYYAWGETTTKSTYSESTYKYFKDGDYHKITKYCSKSSYGYNGFTDTKTTLALSNDAAYANWGGKWRMPTQTQQGELSSECYWVWTESYNNSNVKGFIVYKAKGEADKGKYVYKGKTPSSSYSLSDAHIFLPAAGYRADGDLYYAGSYGQYWSSSLDTFYPHCAWRVCFASDGDGNHDGFRCYGEPVRAVISGE